MDSPRELAKRIARLEKLLERGRYGQLGHSSFEGGGINEYSADGESLRSRYGAQWDGTGGVVQFNGPPPPTPSWNGPEVSVVPGLRGFVVRWQGEWEPDVAGGAQVAPMNLAHIEVHASTDVDFTGLFIETKKAEIVSARGSEVFIAAEPGEAHYFRLVARNTAGQKSTASVPLGPYTALDVADYGTGTTVFYGPDEPTTDKPDLWLKEVDPGPPPQYETYRYDPGVADWVLLKDQGSADALAQAIAAQTAAASKAKIFNQAGEPAWSGDADSAVWFDSDAGNAPYRWDGADFVPMLLGNGAIEPQSLIASDVFVTGTVTAGLLEALMVLTNAIIAGDPAALHARLDDTGLSSVAFEEGLPFETGRYGQGWSVRDAAGEIQAATTEDGVGSFRALSVEDADILVGGITLAERDWERPWGMVGYAELPDVNAYTTATNTELGFLEIAFDPVPGRAYRLHSEPIQYNNDTGQGIRFKLRRTTDGSTPSTSSPQLREVAYAGGTGWGDRQPLALYLGGTDVEEEWRFLLTYGVGNGSTGAKVWRGEVMFFWVEDMGPLRENIGVVIGGGTGGGGTGGGSTPAKVTRTWEATATWVRTWAQNNSSIVTDNEMHQGYGDSFNGNRRASAGWGDIDQIFAGSVIHGMWIYMESYHWWNMSGGTMRLGYHGSINEPATFPGHNNIVSFNFPARVYGQWIRVDVNPNWREILKDGTWRGISIGGADNSAIYYGKFRGPAYGRPRLRVTYTK